MPLAIPGLAAVAAAILAVIVIFAITVFAKAIAGLIPSDIPILSTLHRLILVIADVGSAAVQWVMADVVRPFINVITGPIVGFIRLLAALQHFASSMASSWVWLIQTAIPRLITKLEAFARAVAHTAEVYAVSLVHHLATAVLHDIDLAKNYAKALVHGLAAAVLHDIALARAYALFLTHTLAADVTKDLGIIYHDAVAISRAGDAALGRALHNLEGTVAGITATSIGLVDAGVARAIKVAEGYAADAAANAIHVVDVEAAAALAPAFPGIIDDIDKLIGVIGTDLPDIGAAARAIPRTIPGDLVGALSFAGALSIPMIRFMEQCGVPNCRNLSQYGRELRDLLGALEDGSLIAFLAMLCTDPQGAADVVTNDLAPIIDGAVGAARDLLGVA